MTFPHAEGSFTVLSAGRTYYPRVALGITPADEIDLVALSPSGHAVQIVIVLAEEWSDSDEGFAVLQDKINGSVGFAVDGQLTAAYPEVAHLPWEIVIACRAAPGARTAAYVASVMQAVDGYGGRLRLQQPGEAWPN